MFKESKDQFEINIEGYSKLSEYVKKRFDIPIKYVNDQIRKDIYYIYMSKTDNIYFNYNLRFKEFIYALSFYLYLIFSLPFSSIYYAFIRKNKFDVIYEEMWPGDTSAYKRFYNYIEKHLLKCSTAILVTPIYKPLKKIKKIDEYKNKKTINRGLSNYLFHPYDILSLLKNDFFSIYKLFIESKKSKVNLIMMYLRITRRIIFYKAQTYNVSANVLIGANDYYWNPTKYYIYKNNGFNNIILLQHNYKHDIDANSLYIYCDIYFADSKNALALSKYIIAREKYSIGNVQLSPFVKNEKNYIRNDIFVVHHPIKSSDYDNSSGLTNQALLEMYELFLSHLETFAEKFPQFSIVYVSKKFKDHKILYFNENKDRFKDINNIECVTKYGKETYDLINSSKLLINIFSSLGVQAYGLNKRVLWININNILDSLGLPNTKEDIDIVVEDEYDVFEKKLLNLLQNDSKEMEEFLENKKQEYMNIQENPAIVVANKVLELLEVEK